MPSLTTNLYDGCVIHVDRTENRVTELSWRSLCRRWWLRKLLLWQVFGATCVSNKTQSDQRPVAASSLWLYQPKILATISTNVISDCKWYILLRSQERYQHGVCTKWPLFSRYIQCIFISETYYRLIEVSPKVVSVSPLANESTLVQVMACLACLDKLWTTNQSADAYIRPQFSMSLFWMQSHGRIPIAIIVSALLLKNQQGII